MIICKSVWLSVSLFDCLYVGLPVYQNVWLSVRLYSVCLQLCLSCFWVFFLSLSLTLLILFLGVFSVSVFQYIYLNFCLSLFLCCYITLLFCPSDPGLLNQLSGIFIFCWPPASVPVEKTSDSTPLALQCDQLNMAVCFWYLVKSDLASVRYCTPVHWTSN